jgi:DNA-binding beta-propeller fold protein YncE
LWVTNESGVTVIDTSTLKPTKQIATGAGTHAIVFAADNKFAFVTNRDDGTLSVISVPKLKKLKDVKTGTLASSLTFSPLSKALYVGNEADGRVVVIDVLSHKLLANIATAPGLKTIRFAGEVVGASSPTRSIPTCTSSTPQLIVWSINSQSARRRISLHSQTTSPTYARLIRTRYQQSGSARLISNSIW